MWLPGEEANGRAVAIDGDSLRVDGREVRLFGIDAPEGRQSCLRANGDQWPCGREATALLKRLVRAGPVMCRGSEEDRYGRLVASCEVNGTDLGEEMVRLGFALAYRRHSGAYAQEEARARKAGRGIWSGRFEAPWRWREQQRGSNADNRQ